MILVRLQICGFLSYKDKIEIDFTQFDLACISGANGAGKSSLLEAITWTLFGEARRKDDAIINQHSTTAEVILDFDYEDMRYQVQRNKTRDKSTLLEFRVMDNKGKWKALTEATLRGTEELIRSSLHLDYETFVNASFFLQGKADQFAQQRPGDRKRILSGILGLDIWEEYKEETTRRRRGLESEIALIDSLLAEIEAELKEEKTRKERLAVLEKELAAKKALYEARKSLLDQQRLIINRIANDRKQVEKQAVELQRLKTDLNRSVDDLHERLQEQKNYQLQVQNENLVLIEVENWKIARQALADWESIAANFHQFEIQRQAPLLIIEGERARLQTELDSLSSKQFEINTLEIGLPALKTQVDDYLLSIDELNKQIATRPEIEIEIRRLQDEKARAKAENLQLKGEMDELIDRIARLQETKGAICPTCEKPLNTAERHRLMADLNARGKLKGDTFRANQKTVETCEMQYREKETELLNLQRVEAELKLQQRLCDSKKEELRKTQQDIESWKENGLKRLKEITRTLHDNAYAVEARRELAGIDANLKELGYDAAAHGTVRQNEREGRASQEKLLQLEQAKSALVPLEREIKNLEKAIDKNEAHLATLTTEYQVAEQKLQEESANLPEITRMEREYYEIQEQMNQTINDVGYTRNQVDVLDKQRENRATKLEERQLLIGEIADLKILERAFGKDGIPALLIEQALPEIESHANDILDRLSAGGMSVKFETQRQFKDKKRDDRRETLDILIRDSAGERAYELFSGGEAFRVNFAIRLALSRVLARRSGARLQTLVIDEGFGSQDADGRQRLIEAINLVRSDFAKVLVITHLEELKDAFSARVEVSKSPAGSQVTVVAA